MDSLKCKALLRSIELGSFSAAASELGYSTAGIRQMVTAIENEVGFTILNRGHDGVCLTANGKKIMPALQLYARADATISQISSEINGLTQGKLVIGSYSSISAHWLPAVLKRFKHDYPDISIELMEGVHDELDEWMRSTQMDFCIYSYRSNIDLEWIPLRGDQMYVVVAKTHPFAKRDSVHPSECAGQPLIMPSRGRDVDIIDLLERFHIKPSVEFVTIENYSALSMVEHGLGISIMNELITMGRLNDVVLVPFDPPQCIEMGIAIPSLKAASPAAKKMVKYIRESLTLHD